MLKYSRLAGVLPRIRPHLLAVALLCGAWPACAQWQRVQVASPAFSVDIPDGWSLREVEGRGARILPPNNGPVVEVVAWDALWPPATPEKAAVEHEGVLSRAVDYRRDAVDEIQTDDGASALVVTGRVRARGITEASIFCAYAVGAAHYVMGTFASEEEMPGLRAEIFDHMMRSFRVAAGAAPIAVPPPLPQPPTVEPEPAPEIQPEPAQPTEAQPGPAPPTLEVGGQTEPVGPEAPEPGTPWVQHLSSAGFSVWMPMDWEVGTQDGLITLRPAVATAGSGIALVWPVTGSDPGAEAALRLALTRLPDLRLLRVTSVQELGGVTLIEARATGAMRIAATWAYDQGFGLLRAAAAPEGSWQDELPALARMVAGFRPGQWPVAHRPETEVAGDQGLMRWTLPAGWQVRGGARDEAGDVNIDIEALGSTDEALRVGWQQPVQPRFRALTPLLESLGWREGERYSVPEGGGGLLIYGRRDPEQLVRDLLLPRHPREMRLTAIQAAPPEAAVAGLLAQPDAVGQVVTVKGGSSIGPRERLYLAASARSDGALAPTCWDAASLRADAPEGRLPASVGALAMMVRSARVSDRASATQAGRLRKLIERAQRAIGAIPAELLPESDTGLTSVLDGEPAVTGAGTWTMPGDAAGWWSEQAGQEGAAGASAVPLGTRPGG